MNYIEYRKKRWAKMPLELRLEVLRRDKETCQICGKVADSISESHGTAYERNKNFDKRKHHSWEEYIPFEIDHILALSNGGETELSNLQLLCQKCNRSKGIY